MNILKQLKGFNFDAPDAGSEFAALADALKLVTEGKDNATGKLKHLYSTVKDDSLKSECAVILFDLYFAESDWKQIELNGLLDDSSIDETNRLIARACSQAEQRFFVFPDSRLQVPIELSLTGCPVIEVLINGT